MYKTSIVEYKLSDGTTVNSLIEAEAANKTYTINYIPIYENFKTSDKRKFLKRKLQ